MIQNEIIEITCDCGKVHKLKSLTVEYDSAFQLINYIIQNKYNKIRIFSDHKDSLLLKTIENLLIQDGIYYEESIIKSTRPEIILCDSIKYVGEDYVIVIGDYKLIDIAKYYCSSLGLGISIVVRENVFDFTFSKFARVYDGITFSFYKTVQPDFIICFLDYLGDLDISDLKVYLNNKRLPYFENTLESRINEGLICKKINVKLLKIIDISTKIQTIKNLLNTLIYMGRAISFFGETKSFFGAEMEICNLIEVITKKDFLSCYNMASYVLKKTYYNALNNNLIILNFNLNHRISKTKKILDLPAIACMRFMKNIINNKELESRIKIINALKYMLMPILEYEDEYCLSEFIENKNDIFKALYLSPEFTIKYYFLNLIRDIGYLEKLID